MSRRMPADARLATGDRAAGERFGAGRIQAGSPAVAHLLFLQATVGNQAVARMVAGGTGVIARQWQTATPNDLIRLSDSGSKLEAKLDRYGQRGPLTLMGDLDYSFGSPTACLDTNANVTAVDPGFNPAQQPNVFILEHIENYNRQGYPGIGTALMGAAARCAAAAGVGTMFVFNAIDSAMGFYLALGFRPTAMRLNLAASTRAVAQITATKLRQQPFKTSYF